MTLKTIALVCLIFITTQAREPRKLVAVDRLRWDFLTLEESLWNFVLDYLDNNIKPKEYDEDGPQVSVIRKFEEFGDKINEVKDDLFI